MSTEKYRDLKCSFCQNFFEKPKITACGHNFCFKCLQKYREALPRNQGSSENMIKCPNVNCERIFKIEEFKPEELAPNQILETLVVRAKEEIKQFGEKFCIIHKSKLMKTICLK